MKGHIVDAHVHVWTSDLRGYPLALGFSVADMTPPSFTPEQLLEHAEASEVKRIHLIQMSFYGADHRYLLETLERYPQRFSGAGLLTCPEEGGELPAEQARRMLGWGLRAIRVVGGSLGGAEKAWMQHPGYADLFAFSAENNFVLSFLVSPPDLTEIDKMCERFPTATVVIDHMARIGLDRTAIAQATAGLCALARHPGTYVKVGAYYALSRSGPPYGDLLPLIRQVVEAFGAERCMWESDSPFQTLPPHDYASSVALLRDRAPFLSGDEKEYLFRRTAERILFV